MSKLFEAMASLCFIYNVDFRTLMNEHELCVGEHPSGYIDFLLANPPYNVQRDLNDAHPAYNVFNVNDMIDMAKVLEDGMKPVKHRHVFRSTLKFSSWYKALLLEQKSLRDSIKAGFGEDGSASEGSKSDGLQPAFELENSALRFFRIGGHCQWKTAATRVVHTAVVGMAIHFWLLGATWKEVLGHASYGAHENIGTNNLWWTNAMKNISRDTPENDNLRKRVLLRPRQMSVE